MARGVTVNVEVSGSDDVASLTNMLRIRPPDSPSYSTPTRVHPAGGVASGVPLPCALIHAVRMSPSATLLGRFTTRLDPEVIAPVVGVDLGATIRRPQRAGR